MGKNCSAIYFKNLSGFAESLELPTIQSISLPDSSTIPSKPTVTGEYRNQYVVRNAQKVAFTIWLEQGSYGEVTLDVSKTIDVLENLKKNRIKFNLSTTHTDEESRFLADLVIENISYSRESSRRDRLVCTINAVQIKLIDLTWKQASAVEIFGHDIFTDSSSSGVQIINSSFSPGVTDTDFELSKNSVSALLTKYGDISGFTDMPVSRHIRNAIDKKVTLDDDSVYFKLTEPIDMSLGSRVYNCTCSFTSRYGLGTDASAYTVDLGTFTITTQKKDAEIVENFPLTLGYGLAHPNTNMSEIAMNASTRSSKALKNKQPTCAYPYDFADTYNDYTITKSFEYIEGLDSLAEYLKDAQDTNKFTEDTKAISTGMVVVKNGYVWSYKIKDRYSFTVAYESSNKEFIPDGALKIDIYEINNASNGFKITVSNDDYQNVWDSLFASGNYKMSVVVVTLGALLQVYLFSPTIFNRSRINMNG